ncbi:MAG: glutaminyl-peptide cyclotransferase [Candidatus Poseidoniaceae archaeon]|nr:glutaminyl-peptide cyclotransferase [Candidatus Poseidoniaceae archaeon]
MEQASDMLKTAYCKRVSQLIAVMLFTSAMLNVAGDGQEASTVSQMEVEVVANISHDSGAFTQGLLWHQGMFYESTGLLGESTIREVFPNGTVNRSTNLDAKYFGEGLALVGDTLVQLTWQNNTALIWNLSDFTLIGNFSYQGEGWGLCNNGTALVMSDGSDVINFRDPVDFSIIRTINVTLDGTAIVNLNELECNSSSIWANIWFSDDIIRIDSDSGEVDMVVNASELKKGAWGELNGISIDGNGSMWLTGKNWPLMYEVELVEASIQENNTDGTMDVEQGTGTDKPQSCTLDDECETDAPLSIYLFYSALTGVALSCAVIGIFKVWRALPADKKRAPNLEDVFDDDE